jgi:glycosyltransferase involved in cell wall biosynthesis
MFEENEGSPTLPPITDAAVSVILLAHNEAAHAESVLEGWCKQLEQMQRAYEIIVVDDGSTDATASIVTRIAENQPNVKLLRHEHAEGDGVALQTGLAAAHHPLLFYSTCDRQYLPVDFHLLFADLDRVHIATGFRRWQAVPRPLKLLGQIWRIALRVLFNVESEPLPGWLGFRQHVYAKFMRIVFGLRLRDEGGLFRLFRRAIFERVPIQSQGQFVHDEILAKANCLDALMTEVPIQYRPPSDNKAATGKTPDAGGQWLREFYQVLSHPDFGPIHLGADSKWETLQPVTK